MCGYTYDDISVEHANICKYIYKCRQLKKIADNRKRSGEERRTTGKITRKSQHPLLSLGAGDYVSNELL